MSREFEIKFSEGSGLWLLYSDVGLLTTTLTDSELHQLTQVCIEADGRRQGLVPMSVRPITLRCSLCGGQLTRRAFYNSVTQCEDIYDFCCPQCLHVETFGPSGPPFYETLP